MIMEEGIYHVSFPGLGIGPITVDRTAVTVGGFSIYWYGVIIAVGFILAVIFAFSSLKRYKIKQEPFIDCVLAGLIAGVVGARLFYVIFSWDSYKDNLMEIFNIHNGGLAIYGGIIGGLGAACITAKIVKVNIPAMLDIGGIGFLIGQGIGRWGNFVNQEAFGTPTDLPWGMVSENTGNIPVHPCFLYESLWCLLGVLVLYIVSRKWRKFDGQIFLMYIIWYGLERMIVEGLRTDSLMTPFLGLRVSQIISGALVIIGTVLLIINLKKAASKPRHAAEKAQETAEDEEKDKAPEKAETAEKETAEDKAEAEKTEETEKPEHSEAPAPAEKE